MDNAKIDYVKLGVRLRYIRQSKGLNLEAFANKSGFSKVYISNLEHAKFSNPTINDLHKIATALDIETDDLL
jgi:transcriptional regulator with XRE-family HTH domain